MNTKHQQISACGKGLCLTIPEKAVKALDITTKRFFEWETGKGEIIGTLTKSETVVTTRVQTGRNNSYVVEILHAYVAKYTVHPTKKGGPKATCEWDDSSMKIRIAIA
jgi:hypothetical protein